MEGILCNSSSGNPIQRHSWSILSEQQQGVYVACSFVWAGRYCAVLAVLPYFTSPNTFTYLRSCCSRREQRHECTLVQLVRGVPSCCYTNTSVTKQLLSCPRAALKPPCRGAPIQQGVWEERAGRYDADVEILLLEQQGQRTGLGTPSPQDRGHLVALTQKETCHSVQFLPLRQPVRFHSQEDREQFHLSRDNPVCVGEAWRLWQTVSCFSMPSLQAPASSSICPGSSCSAVALLVRCSLLGGVLLNSHVLAHTQWRDQHIFIQAYKRNVILHEICALPAQSLATALCQGPLLLSLQGKAESTRNSWRLGTEMQTFFKALWWQWLSVAIMSKTWCWAVQRGLHVG